MAEYLRTYKSYDLEEVRKHILILGDLVGDCGACRYLGIDPAAQACPECHTNFKYVTSRRLEAHPGERFNIVRRAHERRPEMVFLDYGDFSKSLGQKKARDFFG